MIRIGICDDEPEMLAELENRINKYFLGKKSDFTLFRFQSGSHVLAAGAPFDIVFLDIRMAGISGMDTAKELRLKDKSCHIVFVTALKEYVLDAFDVNADNYLIKPIEETRFASTMDRILEQIGQDAEAVLSYSYNGNYYRIQFRDIRYCEVLDHTVYLYTGKGNQRYNHKIEQLEQVLDGRFFRCHRSYLINLERVTCCRQGIAQLDGGEQIPVAKRRQSAFLQALLQQQRREVR